LVNCLTSSKQMSRFELMPAGNAKPDTDTAGTPSSVTSSLDWHAILSPVRPFLQAVRERLLDQVNTFEPEIMEHARYALSSQGKQIRSALVALSGWTTGELNEDLVQVAVIIEMIHLATLVHDDIMDHAEVRRNRPTLALRCGTNTSVLLGDCLFAHALVLAAQFPTPEVCRAVAKATKIICSGEILQSEGKRGLSISKSEYFRILRMKTGELFALSCELGARLSGGDYQLYDDCLDLYGEEEQAGKSLGTDMACGKLTLPVLILLERGGEKIRQKLEKKLERWVPEDREELRSWLKEWEVGPATFAMIESYCDKAAHALSVVPDGEGKEALERVAGYLTSRARALVMG